MTLHASYAMFCDGCFVARSWCQSTLYSSSAAVRTPESVAWANFKRRAWLLQTAKAVLALARCEFVCILQAARTAQAFDPP